MCAHVRRKGLHTHIPVGSGLPSTLRSIKIINSRPFVTLTAVPDLFFICSAERDAQPASAPSRLCYIFSVTFIVSLMCLLLRLLCCWELGMECNGLFGDLSDDLVVLYICMLGVVGL